MTSPPVILAVLCLCVAVSELLCRHTPLRHLGTALVVIVLTAVVANLGIIPTYANEGTAEAQRQNAMYDALLRDGAYVAIFWLLLQVSLARVLQAGRQALVLFVCGAIGTCAGVLLGLSVVDGATRFGENHAALGGMFVGTYTGGSLNFNAIAAHYEVTKEGALYAGAVVVDSGWTTVWMAATVALPRLLKGLWRAPRKPAPVQAAAGPVSGIEEDTESLHPIDLGWLGALGLAALAVSDALGDRFGFPPILILSTLALLGAQVPAIRGLRGGRTLGMFGVLLFLACIGALCDVSALGAMGEIGPWLVLFVSIVVLVHGAFTFLCAWLMRIPPEMAAVASQANIGGGTSALALARSLGREDLVLPAILLGSVGTASGTYLGLFVAEVVL